MHAYRGRFESLLLLGFFRSLEGNPMRPHRARLVYSLVNSYGLGKQMSVYRPEPRSFDQLTEFHADGE